MGLGDMTSMVRRMTRLAESIKLPTRRRHTRTTSSPNPAGPVLVRGRGLRRRRPRSPLSSPLPWVVYLLLGFALTSLAFRFLLP